MALGLLDLKIRRILDVNSLWLDMANFKKRGPVRQFSLQCDSPKAPNVKKSLKKQCSEDLPDTNTEHELSIRISVNNKKHSKNNDRPPPAMVAWSEIDKKIPIEDNLNENEMIVKKCSEVKKTIQSQRLIKQSSLERESILYSRQEFNERLRKALKERETTNNKPNLSIILNHTTLNPRDNNDILVDVSNTERLFVDSEKDENQKPKIILPLNPELINNDNNMKNVFQRHIRRTVKQNSLFSDSCYSPTRTNDRREDRCIVVPVVDNKSVSITPIQRSNSLNKVKILTRENSIDNTYKEKHVAEEKKNTTISVEIKQNSSPSTAASRREMFQKRTSSAFHGSTKKESVVVRPPLLRTVSVPVKPEPAKPKFIATKRRVKTAKAKLKFDKDSDDESNSFSRKKCLPRCVSVAGVVDVVTMMSLVSPSGSENEEEAESEVKPEEVEKVIALENNEPPKPTTPEKPDEPIDDSQNFSLRKTVKSVSFQQSSIHAVRSFSASFPGRRGSVVTSLFLNKHQPNQTGNLVQKIQEKRAPINFLEDEENVPKRRLVRTKSAPMQRRGK